MPKITITFSTIWASDRVKEQKLSEYKLTQDYKPCQWQNFTFKSQC